MSKGEKVRAVEAMREGKSHENGTRRKSLDQFGDLLRISELAEWADISLNSAYGLLSPQGPIPVIRFGPSGRVLRVPKVALLELCAQAGKDEKVS